ncbi:MAG: fatty acid desaturase [Planctomycetes bacterium]|nr:fatty acid desaturase [Planctomycetota bacterium]
MDREVMREFTRVSGWRSIALCFALSGAAIATAALGGRLSNYWLALPAILVISGLQFHLMILLHEASHGLLHPNRKINDFVSDLFCAIPFGTLTRYYRVFHLAHHKSTGVRGEDPEVDMFEAMDYRYRRLPKWKLVGMLLADLLFLNLFRYVTWMIKFTVERGLKPTLRDLALNLTFWGALIGASIVFGFWADLLLFWALPYATFTVFFAKLHGYGEHTGETGPDEYARTWTHRFPWIVNFFIYPLNSGLHLEHHLFPRVPWYRIQAFREALLALPTHAVRAEPVTVDGYFFGTNTIVSAMLYDPRLEPEPAPASPLAPMISVSGSTELQVAA